MFSKRRKPRNQSVSLKRSFRRRNYPNNIRCSSPSFRRVMRRPGRRSSRQTTKTRILLQQHRQSIHVKCASMAPNATEPTPIIRNNINIRRRRRAAAAVRHLLNRKRKQHVHTERNVTEPAQSIWLLILIRRGPLPRTPWRLPVRKKSWIRRS